MKPNSTNIHYGFTAAVLLWLSLFDVTHAESVTLQRLFLTPEERTNINDMRTRGVSHVGNPGVPEASTDGRTQLNGYIVKPGNQAELWLNQRVVSANDAGARVIQSQMDYAIISLPSGEQVILKAGQIYDPETKTPMESFEQTQEPESAKTAGLREPPGESPGESTGTKLKENANSVTKLGEIQKNLNAIKAISQ